MSKYTSSAIAFASAQLLAFKRALKCAAACPTFRTRIQINRNIFRLIMLKYFCEMLTISVHINGMNGGGARDKGAG